MHKARTMCRVVSVHQFTIHTPSHTYNICVNIAQLVRFTCYHIPCSLYSPFISSYHGFLNMCKERQNHDETLPTHVFTKPATKQINPDTNLQTPATQDPDPRYQIPHKA